MRILQVHWRYDAFGGGESYLEQLADLLEADGHDLCLMTGASRSDTGRFKPGRVHVTIAESSGIRSGLREIGAVMRRIDRIAPDLVHLHHTGAFLSPYIVAALNRRYPTVKTVHDVSLVCPLGDETIKQCAGELCEYRFDRGCVLRGCYRLGDRGLRPLLSAYWERSVNRQLDRLLVSTEYMRGELLRNDFPESRVNVLPLFTNMNRDGAVAPAAAAQRRLLFVGRLDRAKGGQQLIDALALVEDADCCADVVGEGDLLPALRRQIANGPLRQRVEFHGQVAPSRMPDFYRRARLLVMPSMVPESFGLVGIEAMSCARPVIAFDSGGIRDWLRHDETGFLVERGNVRALASRIEQLLADDKLVEAMGDRGRRRVERLYRPRAHLADLDSIYRSVVANGRKNREAAQR